MAKLRSKLEADPISGGQPSVRYANHALYALLETDHTHVHVQLASDGLVEISVYRGEERIRYITISPE